MKHGSYNISFSFQSLPFPAVTFCNFNAIKNVSLQHARDDAMDIFGELLTGLTGKGKHTIISGANNTSPAFKKKIKLKIKGGSETAPENFFFSFAKKMYPNMPMIIQ